MARYYVETEHIRGESRIYWVAERLPGNGAITSHTRSASEITISKRKAEKECDRLNRQTVDTL